jgi:hypothetical protein
MSLTPGTKLGPYEIVAPIGAGGMGEVYRAKDARLGRDVAIKVLPASVANDPARRERFEREAKAVAALSHPNIINVHDTGVHESHPYVVMELLDGETLREKLAGTALPVRKAVEIAVQIARGLGAAHDKQVVHRDLKPENIFIVRDGQVKILDFGLAKVHEPASATAGASETRAAITDAGMALGTVGYMAPEQIRAQSVDARTDLFAFGAVLYEMLTGARAFQRDTAADTMTAILKEDVRDLSAANAQIPPALDRIVRHSLEKNPQERFQSARDVAFALESLSGSGTGIGSSVQTAAIRPKRGPRAIGIAAALLLVAVAGTVLGWQLRGPASVGMPTIQRITFRRGTIHNARFEPGTSNVVYSASWQGGAPTLYSVHAQSPESRLVDQGSAMLFAISPKQELAVLLSPRLSTGQYAGTLATKPLGGGGARELATRIIAADFLGESAQLVALQDTGDRRRVYSPIGHQIYETSDFQFGLRCAPRGGLIALAGSRGIVFIDQSGAVKARLPDAFPTGMAWSRDGSELWYSQTDGPGQSTIRAVKPGGVPRPIWRGAGLVLSDIAANGEVLVVERESHGGTLVQRASNADAVDFGWLDRSWAVDFSPNGDALLLSELGVAGGDFYMRALDGAPAVRLGRGQALGWSPKGDAVLARKDGDTFLVAPIGAGTTRELTHPGITAYFGWFHPDGRILINGRAKDEPFRYSWIDSAGDVKPARPEGLDHWNGQNVLSHDGRMIAAYQSGTAGNISLAIYPLDGGPPQPVVGLDKQEVVIRFSAGDRHLLVYDRDRLPAKIFELDYRSGKRTLWREFAPTDPAGIPGFPSIVVSADGRIVAFNYIRTLGTAYLLKGLR